MAKWTGTDPIVWAAKMKDIPRDVINNFASEVYSRIAERTPVSDGTDGYGRVIKDNGVRHTGGQARNAWLPSLDSPADGIPPGKDPSGNQTLEKIRVVCESAKGDQSIFLTNNLDYIKSLEFGWYGKWDGDSFTPATTGKVIEGYSRQAPEGMVGKTLAQADQIFESVVEAAKAKNE
jgi:hypothetical protein